MEQDMYHIFIQIVVTPKLKNVWNLFLFNKIHIEIKIDYWL